MVLKSRLWQNAQTAERCIGIIMSVKNAVTTVGGR